MSFGAIGLSMIRFLSAVSFPTWSGWVPTGMALTGVFLGLICFWHTNRGNELSDKVWEHKKGEMT